MRVGPWALVEGLGAAAGLLLLSACARWETDLDAPADRPMLVLSIVGDLDYQC